MSNPCRENYLMNHTYVSGKPFGTTTSPRHKFAPALIAISALVTCGTALGQTGGPLPLANGAATVGALSILVLGFVLGLRHALDADHLIAVSAIVGESKELSGSSAIGVLWGLGHTASLLLVGVAVIALQIEIPERIALAMEFGVAVMLIGLGVRVVWKLMRGGTLHVHVHSHENHGHAHPHIHPPGEEHILDHRHTHHSTSFAPMRPAWWQSQARKGKRSIFIGMVHGLAGSAPLMLIVLTTIPSPSLALSYIGMFGLGSVGGMLVMSTLIGLPFALTARRSQHMNIVIRALSGGLSIAFGVFLAWQIGFVEGLFL